MINEKDNKEIIEALGIGGCSEELRGEILAKFGAILFKRLLLLLPDGVATKVIAEITALPLPEGMERLIALIDMHIPDGAARRGELLEETILEFRRDVKGP